MEITLGKTYYYNNRGVVPIEKQGDADFYKCIVNFNPVLDMRGVEFCAPCMCCSPDGSHPTHCHDEYQEVIDVLNEEKHTQDIMFLPASMLKEHYFEYRENEQLKDEIKKGKEKLESLKKEINESIETIKRKQSQIFALDNMIEEVNKSLKDTKENILSLQQEEIDIKESIKNNKGITLQGTSKTISVKHLLSLLEIKARMNALDIGGVHHWDWYGESLQGHDFEKEALQELLSI